MRPDLVKHAAPSDESGHQQQGSGGDPWSFWPVSGL